MTAARPKPGEVWYQHVSDGEYALDGGAMFGVVPRNLWSQKKPPDDQNRIHLGLNCLLIRTHDRTILVDDGIGTKDSEKFRAIYKVMQPPTLPEDLGRYGLTVEDITDVILTHLHFDHAGGSTVLDADGNAVPTFPNAQYYVHQINYDEAKNAHERNKASYLAWNWLPIEERGRLTIVEDGQIIPDTPKSPASIPAATHAVTCLSRRVSTTRRSSTSATSSPPPLTWGSRGSWPTTSTRSKRWK